jgi:hypothetical protein
MYKVEIARVDTSQECAGQVRIWLWSIDFDKVIHLEIQKNMKFLTFIRLILLSNDFWQLFPLKLEKIKLWLSAGAFVALTTHLVGPSAGWFREVSLYTVFRYIVASIALVLLSDLDLHMALTSLLDVTLPQWCNPHWTSCH